MDEAVDAEMKVSIKPKNKYRWKGPYATFEWYQPAKSTSYRSLRRYSAGDRVNAYNVYGNVNAD